MGYYASMYNVKICSRPTPARVVELVDTQDLKSCGHLSVRVQVPPLVHSLLKHLIIVYCHCQAKSPFNAPFSWLLGQNLQTTDVDGGEYF
jgi:hypothetical protein